jgi:hypothetical protein
MNINDRVEIRHNDKLFGIGVVQTIKPTLCSKGIPIIKMDNGVFVVTDDPRFDYKVEEQSKNK